MDLGEIERAQAELLELVEQLQREPDLERQARLVKAIGDRSSALQARCEALEAEARASATELRGDIEVVLTTDQRRQIKERTGIDMETVLIADHGGGLVAAMPNMDRAQVLTYAMEEAERRQREAEARRAARAELARIRAELEQAPEQVRMEIERLLQDPEFRRAFEDTPHRRR